MIHNRHTIMSNSFMKGRSILFLTALLLLPFLSGCTRNDGNIGKQFGQWKLVSITRDGVDDQRYGGNIYWSFQSSTIEIKETTPHKDVWHSFGNYRIADETLFLSFPDKDFPPRPALGLPREAELQIVKFTTGIMILYYNDGNDGGITYTLHKW